MTNSKEKGLLYTRKYREKHRDRYLENERKRKQKQLVGFQAKLLNLKKERGGKCTLCGYDDEVRILHFHHLRDKKFNLSNYNKPLKEMQEEAEKCVLLCPNCHALTHLRP